MRRESSRWCSALLEKGAALGTVLAFMMSVIALSLPETIILRKVLKPTLIATFVGVVGFRDPHCRLFVQPVDLKVPF